MRRPRILICNDDGINGPGLRPLIAAMRRMGKVTTVVPGQERSADSHSLTLHKPIRVHRLAPDLFTLNGSPADCARLGIIEILKGRVDLVVSGINRGYNLGEDVVYSGTVAAAREATLLEVFAIAFSQDPDCESYGPAAAFAARLARLVLKKGIPPGVLINVNFPTPRGGRFAGAEATRLGRRVYSQEITRRKDPRGGHYYWLAGSKVSSIHAPGSDVTAVARGRVAVTPIHIDTTAVATLERLKSWPLQPQKS